MKIPKPNGGTRKSGIPAVMDWGIQQTIAQVLTPIWGEQFSEYRNGFRPDRGCEMAVREFLFDRDEGSEWIADMDQEKFFGNVPQEKRMSYVHTMENDGDTESLIRKDLKAGVMAGDHLERTEKGTTGRGSLSIAGRHDAE